MTEAVALQLAHPERESEQNPYLLGVFAPVRDEITAEDLEVIGEIPRDLNGVYLRNGPNRRYAAPGRYHWFDGDGMVHAMHFENGRARYRNRCVRDRGVRAESEAAGSALWTGVMESPTGNPVGTARGLPLKDTANTDVVYHDGRCSPPGTSAGSRWRSTRCRWRRSAPRTSSTRSAATSWRTPRSTSAPAS